MSYAVNGKQAATIEFLLPHFPKSRQEKVKRQSHLWHDEGKKKESQIAARLQSAMERPALKKRPTESLFRSQESGDEKKFLQLLAAGADPNETNAEGTTILASVASHSTVYTLLKPLLKAGANPNRGELFRPLNFAASFGAEEVQLLLKAGADVNWADPDGGTALSRFIDAANGGDVEYVNRLLAEGIRVDVANSSGDTALHLAARNGDVGMMELLLKAGAPIEAEGCADWTPLLTAANGGEIKAVWCVACCRRGLKSIPGTQMVGLHFSTQHCVRALKSSKC